MPATRTWLKNPLAIFTANELDARGGLVLQDGVIVEVLKQGQQSHICRPGADHVQWPASICFAAAAHAFTVNGHRAVYPACYLGEPLLAGPLQLFGIEQAKHPCKGIVRGNARGQRHQALKPVLVLLTELGHLYAVVCACDGGAQSNHQDRLQFVAACALHAGIGDVLQVLQQAHLNSVWQVTQALQCRRV